MKRLLVVLLAPWPLTGAAQAQTLKDLMATLAASWNQPTEFVDPNEFNAYAASWKRRSRRASRSRPRPPRTRRIEARRSAWCLAIPRARLGC